MIDRTRVWYIKTLGGQPTRCTGVLIGLVDRPTILYALGVYSITGTNVWGIVLTQEDQVDPFLSLVALTDLKVSAPEMTFNVSG